MVNTEIRLIIFFAAKDGEALDSQQKQDRELTGTENELKKERKKENEVIANFRRNWRKYRKPLGHSGMT